MEGYVAAPTPREYRTIDITVDVNSAERPLNLLIWVPKLHWIASLIMK